VIKIADYAWKTAKLRCTLCVNAPAIAQVRLKHFGKGYLSPTEVKVLNPRKILDFSRAIKLEEVYRNKNGGVSKDLIW
jgi:hypothetical protein